MENKSINKKLFGKRIKEAREKLGYTQFQLAEKIGVSQNFLGDIERGIKLHSLNKLILLSNCLKLSLDTMFADSLLKRFKIESAVVVFPAPASPTNPRDSPGLMVKFTPFSG